MRFLAPKKSRNQTSPHLAPGELIHPLAYGPRAGASGHGGQWRLTISTYKIYPHQRSWECHSSREHQNYSKLKAYLGLEKGRPDFLACFSNRPIKCFKRSFRATQNSPQPGINVYSFTGRIPKGRNKKWKIFKDSYPKNWHKPCKNVSKSWV